MSRTRNHTYSSVQPRTRVLLDDAMMRDVLADVAAMRTALELELWASWMLGQAWKQRTRQPHFAEVDWMLIVGSPIVAMMAEIGGARARKALTAISLLERGALGHYAGTVALGLPGARAPEWMNEITDSRFVRVRHGAAGGDGEAIIFDLERDGTHDLSVAVFIDERLGGAVKWIRLLGPMPTPGTEDSGSEMLTPADLGEVAARVRAGIAAADRNPRHHTNPEFADLRAFLLARLIDVTG